MPLGIEIIGRAVAKRAHRGLFHGRQVLFGNKVSEDGGNKSRRRWKPNVQSKRLYSETLDKLIRVNVTTQALRCIDRAGGLDNYILHTPERQLNSDFATKLRVELLRALRPSNPSNKKIAQSSVEGGQPAAPKSGEQTGALAS